MQPLLTMLMTWLALNFGLPVANDGPRIEYASADAMAAIRNERLANDPARTAEIGALSPDPPNEGVYAIYDDLSRTIFLPADWSAASPAEVSLLVHELVHHLQNAGGLRYACPGEREKLAYEAQARWLALFDRTLAEEFGIDPMTLLVRTRCMG